MVPRMKTTLEIPDALLIAAKQRAAEERKPLRELVIDGLRSRLQAHSARRRTRVRWITSKGGVPPEMHTRAGMYEWLERNR
jgi:hypothetical protein